MSSDTQPQDKYRRIQKEHEEKYAPNEIRVKAGTSLSPYILYAARLFFTEKMEHVLIKASGAAIPSACKIADVLRRRIKGLAMILKITNIEIQDEYEALEEGLDNITMKRTLSVLEIKLSTDEKDKANLGYVAPLPEDKIEGFRIQFTSPQATGILFLKYFHYIILPYPKYYYSLISITLIVFLLKMNKFNLIYSYNIRINNIT